MLKRGEKGELRMERGEGNAVEVKSYEFALRIVNMYRYLTGKQREYVLSKQVLRSGTAIGALYAECQHAQSKADFINKASIALKEANETLYWLRLLHDSNYLSDNIFQSIYHDADELVALFVAIVKSAKKNA